MCIRFNFCIFFSSSHSEFSAILSGQFTRNVTSIVCEYSGSEFDVSKRAMEQRGRSIERNLGILIWVAAFGRSIPSGQKGQKRPIAKDWMLQSAFVETRGLGSVQTSVRDGLSLGNHAGTAGGFSLLEIIIIMIPTSFQQ